MRTRFVKATEFLGIFVEKKRIFAKEIFIELCAPRLDIFQPTQIICFIINWGEDEFNLYEYLGRLSFEGKAPPPPSEDLSHSNLSSVLFQIANVIQEIRSYQQTPYKIKSEQLVIIFKHTFPYEFIVW